MGKFNVDDKVSVTSKGHGKTTVRIGKIVSVFEPGKVPIVGLFRYKIGKPRRHESYLIFTTTNAKRRAGAAIDNHTDRFLWPRVGCIKLVRRAPVKK